MSPSNFYIQPGEGSLNSLMKKLGTACSTELSGLHAGVNSPERGIFPPVQGAVGGMGGRLARPLPILPWGGSFLELLQGVQHIGGDLRFSLPSGSCFGSPSLCLAPLAVSGQG